MPSCPDVVRDEQRDSRIDHSSEWSRWAAAALAIGKLWRAIAAFLKGVSKDECKAYLANSGYT
jgi:hypothetical protein